MALRILAVVAGLLAGMMVNLGLILASSTLFPLPDGADTNTVAGLQRLAEYIATLPVSAFVLVLAAHQVGAFIGGLVTASIARSSWLWDALAVGIVFLLLGGLNLLQIPHPLGFALVDLLFYIPMAIAGGSLARYVLPPTSESTGSAPTLDRATHSNGERGI